VGGRKSPFPVTLANGLYNSLYYHTSRDNEPNICPKVAGTDPLQIAAMWMFVVTMAMASFVRYSKLLVRNREIFIPHRYSYGVTTARGDPSGGSKRGQRPPPHLTTALSGSIAQLNLWNCCTCLLAFEFAQALTTVSVGQWWEWNSNRHVKSTKTNVMCILTRPCRSQRRSLWDAQQIASAVCY